MKATDAALIASALVFTGRHALAIYEGEQFTWPEDYEKLTKKLVKQLEMISTEVEPVKKTKTAPEEEPVVVTVGLMPNFSAGERLLNARPGLKAKLSEILQDGVEFNYAPSDLGWQWALDRANWSTISGGEVSRRIKVRTSFTEGAVGIEIGTTVKRRSTKKAEATKEAPAEAVAEVKAAEPTEVADAVEVAETAVEA